MNELKICLMRATSIQKCQERSVKYHQPSQLITDSIQFNNYLRIIFQNFTIILPVEKI
jgi:hypothetical protein